MERVSCSLNEDGEQQIIMVVLAFPPETKLMREHVVDTKDMCGKEIAAS